jgi:hypothetical protein
LALGTTLFKRALAGAQRLTHPRALSFALIGIRAYLNRYSGDSEARRARREICEKIYAPFTEHANDDWPWFQDELSYANAKVAHALLLAGTVLPDKAMLHQGFATLDWLMELKDYADKCMNWFLGQNDLDAPLYNFSTTGCYDGLQPDGANFNQGAESTLAWLMSLIAIYLDTTDQQTLLPL